MPNLCFSNGQIIATLKLGLANQGQGAANANSKGRIMSEDTGRNLNQLFTVKGRNFKFSAQNRDLEYVFGEVKIFQYRLKLSHL